MFMLKKLLVEKEHVELLCMLNWSMLNYMRDEIMYVEKLACWFQCISKYLHFEKFVGRTPTFQIIDWLRNSNWSETTQIIQLEYMLQEYVDFIPGHCPSDSKKHVLNLLNYAMKIKSVKMAKSLLTSIKDDNSCVMSMNITYQFLVFTHTAQDMTCFLFSKKLLQNVKIQTCQIRLELHHCMMQ